MTVKWKRVIVPGLCAACALTPSLIDAGQWERVTPWTGLRWQQPVPEIRHEGVWYELKSINDVPVSDILDHCQNVFEGKERKRFAEDITEVMASMNKPLGERVNMHVKRLDNGESVVLRDVALTETKRRMLQRRQQPDDTDVNRVQREHDASPPARFRALAKRLGNDAYQWPARPLSAQKARQDLDQLEWHLEDQASYLTRKGVDYHAALDAVRSGLDEPIRLADLAVQLAKVIALLGDGHAGLPRLEGYLPRGYLPVLIERDAHGYVAIREDRISLLSANHAYLVEMDGIPIQRWLDAGEAIVPAGSPQFLERLKRRNLRFLRYLRAEMELPLSRPLTVTLADVDGKSTEIKALPVAERKPFYGQWPRHPSRKLDGEIGYLRIRRMDDRLSDHILEQMDAFRSTRGLIIDVRDNGGGTRSVLRTLFPYLMKPGVRPHVANTARYRLSPQFRTNHLAARFMYPIDSEHWNAAQRTAIEQFTKTFQPQWLPAPDAFSPWHYFVLTRSLNPSAYYYDKPVVVLQNGGCFSATDICLGALKGWPNVTLMGTASGGGSGRSQSIRLAHSGITVRLSSMASFHPSGKLYDGNGIAPDVIVHPKAADFAGTSDHVLETALQRLRD